MKPIDSLSYARIACSFVSKPFELNTNFQNRVNISRKWFDQLADGVNEKKKSVPVLNAFIMNCLLEEAKNKQNATNSFDILFSFSVSVFCLLLEIPNLLFIVNVQCVCFLFFVQIACARPRTRTHITSILLA